jgi:mRNA-degrading endonuclease RelE of RelBE toxin-antitoxin system
MGEYTITFKASVEKDFRKLPRDRASHILEVIEGLSRSHPQGSEKALRNRRLLSSSRRRIPQYIGDLSAMPAREE